MSARDTLPQGVPVESEYPQSMPAHLRPGAERPKEFTSPYSCGIVYQQDGYKVLRMETGKSRYEYDVRGTLGKTVKRCKTKREAVEIVQGLARR